MTKKHFNLVAKTIEQEVKYCRDNGLEQGLEALEALVNELALNLAVVNVQFDRDKFISVCGF